MVWRSVVPLVKVPVAYRGKADRARYATRRWLLARAKELRLQARAVVAGAQGAEECPRRLLIEALQMPPGEVADNRGSKR
eukprot:3386566-Alexandrium_andersonii.AAC.1